MLLRVGDFDVFLGDSSNMWQLGISIIDLYRKSIWNKCHIMLHMSNSSHTPNGTGIFTYAFTIHLGEHVGTPEK